MNCSVRLPKAALALDFYAPCVHRLPWLDFSQTVARSSEMSKPTLVVSGIVLSPSLTFSVTAMLVFPTIAHLALVVAKEHFKHLRDVTALTEAF